MIASWLLTRECPGRPERQDATALRHREARRRTRPAAAGAGGNADRSRRRQQGVRQQVRLARGGNAQYADRNRKRGAASGRVRATHGTGG